MTDTVGKRLKKLRTDLSLSQEAFGEKIGLTRASIAKVESDKNNLSQDALCRLIFFQQAFCQRRFLKQIKFWLVPVLTF